MRNKENYTTKPISEFTESDTLYMQRTIQGFSYTFKLSFKSISKGIVKGIILDIQPNNMNSVWC